jgi:hypothetical protein
MKVYFDILHLYYLPQYLPVAQKLQQQGVDCQYVFYRQEDPELQLICEAVARKDLQDVKWVDSLDDALQYYNVQKPDWVVFGNTINRLDEVLAPVKTALMGHGIGPKTAYYAFSKTQTDVRFVEGQHRLKRLESLYPNGHFVDTGYSKLDPAINDEPMSLTLESIGLDPNKPTILYAPTFYPSSIELFSKQFAQDFEDYNIIIKPHFFSMTKKKYRKQRRILEAFASHPNVYLAYFSEYNLLPFMALSDVMLSDASSAIFEFAALGKPVVWCDFYKLRWSYRGIFKYRFKNRLDEDLSYFNDVAVRVEDYKAIRSVVTDIDNQKFPRRDEVIEQLAGRIDGQCSDRIVNYLLEN